MIDIDELIREMESEEDLSVLRGKWGIVFGDFKRVEKTYLSRKRVLKKRILKSFNKDDLIKWLDNSGNITYGVVTKVAVKLLHAHEYNSKTDRFDKSSWTVQPDSATKVDNIPDDFK